MGEGVRLPGQGQQEERETRPLWKSGQDEGPGGTVLQFPLNSLLRGVPASEGHITSGPGWAGISGTRVWPGCRKREARTFVKNRCTSLPRGEPWWEACSQLKVSVAQGPWAVTEKGVGLAGPHQVKDLFLGGRGEQMPTPVQPLSGAHGQWPG